MDRQLRAQMNTVSRAYNAFERTTAYGGHRWDEARCRVAWDRYMTVRQEQFRTKPDPFFIRDMTGVT